MVVAAKPYRFSEKRRQGLILLAVLVALTVLAIGINAELSFVWRNVFNALNAHNYLAFRKSVLLVVGVFIIFIPGQAFYPWFSGRLRILWREWITQRLLKLESTDRACYRIGQGGAVDNSRVGKTQLIRKFSVVTTGLCNRLIPVN